MLGGKKEKLTIPEGTPTGKTFTIRGKGITEINNSKRQGNVHVRVNVEIPTNLTGEQKKILKSFDETFDKKNNQSTEREGFFKKFFGK